jgi:hypothetical protein
MSDATKAAYRPMQWTPVLGNCNEQFWTTATEYVRCTAVDRHEGLHRCHFEGQGPQHQLAVWMWGDDRDAVSIEALRSMPNPLGLLPPPADEQPGHWTDSEGVSRCVAHDDDSCPKCAKPEGGAS